MMAYVKMQKAADRTFNIFAFCWVLSRIGLLPYRIIYYSSYVALALVPMFSAYYIFNGLLIALQTLHIIWTYFIIRVAIHAWNNNGIRDIRSDDEADECLSSGSSSPTGSKRNSKLFEFDEKNISGKEAHSQYLNGDAKRATQNGTKSKPI